MSRLEILGAVLLLITGSFAPVELDAQTSNPAEASASVRDAPRSPTSEFVMRPGDLLRVSVWPDASLGGEFVVEETGFVYLPFLGEVRAAGSSLDRLRAQLREGYGEVMKNPVVSVLPVFRVGVQGAVRGPGIYQVTPTQTLLDVIGMAGGFVERADPKKIRIVRQEHGRMLEIDLARTLESGVQPENLRLLSGDQIVVPTRGKGVTFSGVMGVVQSLGVVALIVERFVN